MLKPCLSCARLVRGVETSCPFCNTAISVSPVPAVLRRRMMRAASIAAVAAMGVGCGGVVESTDAGADAAADAPIKDSATKDVTADAPSDANTQDVISVPPYGVPPIDGGK